jgi:hypothetical protein
MKHEQICPSMKSGTYQLRGGRTVHLRHLSVARTYGGLLTGSLKTGSKMVLDALHKQARNVQPFQPPLLVVVPEKLPLADYMWTAELESQKGVRTHDPDFSSHLSVCWFSKDLRESIDCVIASLISSLDWDRNASDYDTTFI